MTLTLNKEMIPLYHADARVYEVTDNDNQTIGILYMDFHPRKGKTAVLG